MYVSETHFDFINMGSKMHPVKLKPILPTKFDLGHPLGISSGL